MRSKVKRTFRSKKRESGVYAATEASRLQRLNARLVEITKADRTDVVAKEVVEAEDPGWCWLACFGLLDPNDITLESLERLGPHLD